MIGRSRARSQTIRSFDYQWRHLARGKYLLSDQEFREQVEQIICSYTSLPRGWFAGKRVCDGGCGNGRFTYGLCRLGAQVTALDISEAGVQATLQNCQGMGEVTAIQWDLLVPKPDFSSQFDLVFCFGVLHHTGDTRKALDNVASWVAPSGYLFVMIYNHKPRSAARRYALFRTLLKPFPLSWRPALIRLLRPERLFRPRESWKVLTREERESLVHAHFDAFSPSINDTHSAEEVWSWLEELGFTDIRDTQPLEHNHLVVARKVGA